MYCHIKHERIAKHERSRTPPAQTTKSTSSATRAITFSHALVLIGTTIPEVHLQMRINGRTRIEYFVDRSVTHPFISILLVPRLFPQKILEKQVLKTRSKPYVAMVLIKYRADELTLTTSFLVPLSTHSLQQNLTHAARPIPTL